MTIKSVSDKPDKELCVLPTPDSWEYVSGWMKKLPNVKNEVTVRRSVGKGPILSDL